MPSSDHQEDIGLHIFEKAGLGKAPFRFIGYVEKTFQATPDSPVQVGGSCDYCGTGIIGQYWLQSVDGKKFKVGCDCIEKSGDKGLIKAYRSSPEFRKKAKEARQRADGRVKEAWAILTNDPVAVQKLNSFTTDTFRGKEPWFDFAKRAWTYCGASGRARYLRTAKKLIAEFNNKESVK